jgi:hypothetical protein
MYFKFFTSVQIFKNNLFLNYSAEMAERSNAPGLRPGSFRNGGSNPSLRVYSNEESSSGFLIGSSFVRRKIIGFEEDWRKFLWTLSGHDLEKLCKLRKEVYFQKFPSRLKKKCLSSNVYRVFSDQDLFDFFSVIKPSEVKMGIAFFLQLTCGFRIGEINPIKLEHVDFRKGVISLITEKANLFSDQPVPAITLEVLQEWVEHNKKEIEETKCHCCQKINSKDYIINKM